MREILFKAKPLYSVTNNIVNSEWVQGSYIKKEYVSQFYKNGKYGLIPQERHYIENEIYVGGVTVNGGTVCQYTNFDLCNQKVFENDILFCEEKQEKYIVEWSKEECKWVARVILKDDNHFSYLCPLYTCTESNGFRVIGNIHDNKESYV